MKNAQIILAFVTFIFTSIQSIASELSDACKYISQERNSRYLISGMIDRGETSGALKEWNAMVDRLNAHSRYARILIANNFNREDVLNIFLARWETNMVSGTDIRICDVLKDTTLIDRRRKWFFDRYQIPDELIDAYYTRGIGDNSPRHLVIPFLPWKLNVDGSPNNNAITYLGGGFIGRDYQTDARRTAIAVHLWKNKDRYASYFDKILDARSYMDELYSRIDNPANYLKILRTCESGLAEYAQKKGKITYRDYQELLPRIHHNFDSSKCFSAKITRVVDGDTIIVTPYNESNEVVVRLDKIDAPEKGQPFGREAKEYLSSWTGYEMRIYYSKKDRYGRVLGSIVSMLNNQYVNLRMVSDGFAWHYTDYDSTPEFSEAESDARRYRLNIWSDSYPVRPSDWRRRNVLTDSDNASTYGM